MSEHIEQQHRLVEDLKMAVTTGPNCRTPQLLSLPPVPTTTTTNGNNSVDNKLAMFHSTPIKKAKKVKKPPTRGKMVTGYIIYASEIRREIIKKHPEKDFGEISKIVGGEWKNLDQETKVSYEKRANEQNSICKIQFMASAAAQAAAANVTTTTTTTTTTVNVVTAANGSPSMGDSSGQISGEESIEKTINDCDRQASQQQQQYQQQPQQQLQLHQLPLPQQLMLQHQQQQQQQFNQAYFTLIDQAPTLSMRPTSYQGPTPNSTPTPNNDTLLDQQSHSQHSQSPVLTSPSQQHPQLQHQQQQHQPYHQTFSRSQPMPTNQQQQPAQLPYQFFQYQQQPTMVQYCNDPCCASGRYQSYPFSQASPSTPTSMQQQQQHQQQQQQYIQLSQDQSPPLVEQYNLYKRNNIIYRKPSFVRLQPKDVATQTESPIFWNEKVDSSPKKELRFSEKFIQHISTLGGNSPTKITDAAESH